MMVAHDISEVIGVNVLLNIQNLPQMTPAVGFDRLRDIGLSQEDIQVIRERFHQLHGTEGAG